MSEIEKLYDNVEEASKSVHKDVFHITSSVKAIPRGTVKRINGSSYAWTGKKWKLLPEKPEKPGRQPEV
jgi:hypothetical protein